MDANVVRARVGIVDKFQGQEVPIVIYTITASSQADAPEGKIPLRTILLHPSGLIVLDPSGFGGMMRWTSSASCWQL